ncbi:SAM-dependent methyltransferase [Saccharothrix tamanrassetensis]|uniref:SAM-dependent methyltransferase n=1 Tax=Saccharothrix tamanrassetensis TaxID=1051531 RepID=A0A841CPC5_9PSEU|nr:class I SAM-dependent methyltransferase [Saccharothrix tamanrassetensis]MBB5957927.1 SAM-dependent methyltransferase [Saccharothrix tamanrassetensis]
MTTAEQFWEGFYLERDQVWSGRPNPLLVREASTLTPGTALDLGCAEGGDAVWLAQRGWRVVGTDVSATALRRAAAHAADAGVADLIRWERHDLAQSFPGGTFDLVSAQFLHSPVALDGEREAVLRRAVGSVAAGGVLLIVGHAGWPTWMTEPPAEVHFPTTEEVLSSLRLDDRWEVEVQELVDRELTGPEGQTGRRIDNVLRIRRR